MLSFATIMNIFLRWCGSVRQIYTFGTSLLRIPVNYLGQAHGIFKGRNVIPLGHRASGNKTHLGDLKA